MFTCESNPCPVFQEEPVSMVPFVLTRAIRDAPDPEYVVKNPPITIFWSDWTAIEYTELLKPTPWFHEEPVSAVPSVFNLTIRFLADPEYVEKNPPITIFWSDWTTVESTLLLAPVVPILNVVSFVPLVFNRTIPLLADPEYVPKPPPTIIFPSDWVAAEYTVLENPVPMLKLLEINPLLSNILK